MKDKTKTQMKKILETLDREGPLSNVKVSEKSGVKQGTVRCYTSLLNKSGLITHYKDLRGIFMLTQEGRDWLHACIVLPATMKEQKIAR